MFLCVHQLVSYFVCVSFVAAGAVGFSEQQPAAVEVRGNQNNKAVSWKKLPRFFYYSRFVTMSDILHILFKIICLCFICCVNMKVVASCASVGVLNL